MQQLFCQGGLASPVQVYTRQLEGVQKPQVDGHAVCSGRHLNFYERPDCQPLVLLQFKI